MDDLYKDELKSQITLAFYYKDYFSRWGIHYLPNLFNIYIQQIYNNFKDLEPLKFGVSNPLFIVCCNKLNTAFDKLPIPRPSNDINYEGPVDIVIYYRASNPCFSAETPIAFADNRLLIISQLQQNTYIQTPTGLQRIFAILYTLIQHQSIYYVDI